MKLRRGVIVFLVSLVLEMLLLISIMRWVSLLPLAAEIRFSLIIVSLMALTALFVYENFDFPPDEEELDENDYR